MTPERKAELHDSLEKYLGLTPGQGYELLRALDAAEAEVARLQERCEVAERAVIDAHAIWAAPLVKDDSSVWEGM